ncbi:hypothetical protein [Haladaptatus sp. CMAA 1911]|uniref:hypothetical protein n=1 Tax=unclassified Haladaptatus TaxID=2622732 RepID=UPI0037547414
MSTNESRERDEMKSSTCPWCAENIAHPTDCVQVAPPARRPPEHRPTANRWFLHTDCAAEWREFVTHLRTLAGRGAFRTLVEGPLSGDVNEMLEWEMPDTS